MRLLKTFFVLLILSITINAQFTSDFRPVVGRASSDQGFPPYRLLVARSTDGITWTRTNKVLGDRASVADGLILPNGRILIYFVAGGKIVNGTEQQANDIVVAVSDNNGSSWIYKNVTFNNVPLNATMPVDPNVVLLDDNTIRMFVTIDPDMEGNEKPQSYSALSTDGGFTYSIEGKRFSVTNTEILDPENFRFADNDWRLWSGGVPGKNIFATSTDGDNFTSQGEFCIGVSDNPLNCYIVADVLQIGNAAYRIYTFGPMGNELKEGICLFESTNAETWTINENSKFQVDASAGVESDKVWAPGVIKITDINYLMIYETQIPTNYSTTENSVTIESNETQLLPSDETMFTALVDYTDNTIRDYTSFVTWVSSDHSVATISSTGVVTAVGVGTTNITAQYNGLTSNTVVMTVYVIPPAAPSNLAAVQNQSNQIELNWHDNSNDETGFVVERKIDNGDWNEIVTVNANVTTYIDNITQGTNYTYRVKAYNDGGSSDYSNESTVTVTSVDEINTPNDFSLLQNYPNPFNPSTKIVYNTPVSVNGSAVSVKLVVYDIVGNEIATLVNTQQHAGMHEVIFNSENLSSGVYLYKLTAGKLSQTRKMVILK